MFWIIIATFLLGLYFLKFRQNKKDITPLQKPFPEKDLVYLVQFPVSPMIRSISPFALKLETYLRLKNVRYEPVYSLKMSKKGQIPYIELNGEQIPDSNICIKELEKRGLAQPDEVSEENIAINHLIQVTLENHTSTAGFHWRYCERMKEFCEKLTDPYYPKKKAMLFFRYLQPKIMKIKTFFHGIGRHSLDEMAEFSNRDLKAISTLLGDRPFFNGENPSTIDCTLFGHLVQFVLIPMAIPQKDFIDKECPNLKAFVERMKDRFWPDWEKMCQASCMNGKKAESMF